MKNIITAWLTSLIGAAIILLAIAYWSGYLELPSAEVVPKWAQISIAFVVGFVLLRMPETLEGFIVKILDLAFGWLKKKSE